MSRMVDREPQVEMPRCSGLELVIVPRTRDLGGFEVRRVLPSEKRQMVGPFIFFDQMGPAAFERDGGIDVRPHPHIGLATVTYLFEGEILHRDSLGSIQPIRPGEVNWMTAGRGIVHSERTAPETRAQPSRLAGIQAWVALPRRDEETAPDFSHHASAALPEITNEGTRIRLIAGELFHERSPVKTHSPLFYADARMEAGSGLVLPAEHEERAVYVFEGNVEIGGQVFDPGRLLVFKAGDDIPVRAPAGARLLLLGGAPMDGPRFIWWNFVASSRERIEQAKADWAAGRFPSVPGDDEFIPLPSE